MSDYSKLKNAELEAMLKERSLPHTGKKADMIARLREDDEKKASKTPAAAAEDEIDWDDDATNDAPKPFDATTAPGAAAIAAGGQGRVANPQSVPNQVADIDPSMTDDLTVKAPTDEGAKDVDVSEAKTTEKEKTPVNFSSGLKETTLEEELEKRKARAKKFGLPIEDDDEIKKLERAKKFGETAAPKGLNQALPERSRKRGRDGDDDSGRGGKRGGRRFDGRRGGRKPARQDRDRRDDGERKPKDSRTEFSEADRKRNEARKQRFAAAAS
ncbi:hypothetical protein M501DRAFT_1032616 [Patellaria atrata CBS 101060]|uniref:SAP domain-containing protein n=1 Tax=Patellaria atrata CBS 101060 TaxID=1346257 RepID=A0A9P4S8K1_9PEZI|nr:hypothetical protein M501DRAFT_1032616 [Patellaria atrata CBS 101060]